MKIFNFIFKITLVALMVSSCVPARKYYQIEGDNKYYVDKVKRDSVKLSKLTQVNGDQLMHILSLKRDSIKYHYDYDSLYIAYKKTDEIGKIKIANIKRELNNRDIEVSHIEQHSNVIIHSFRSFDVETNTIYRQLAKIFYRYRNRGAKIDKEYWNVVITLPDDLLYADDKFAELSQSGRSLIGAIASLTNRHPKYHMDIIEYSLPTQNRYVVVDSTYTRTVTGTVEYKVDSTQQVLNVPYCYEVKEVTQKELVVNSPASMVKGTTISNYIEELKRLTDLSYSGVVYTYKPNGVDAPELKKNTVEIVISPKLTSLLKDVGLL